MRVIIKSNWAPYVGTDYTEALGIYDDLRQAQDDAECYAWERWEGGDDDSDFEDEGPDITLEEYDPAKHDGKKAGGGSFEDDFLEFEKFETIPENNS